MVLSTRRGLLALLIIILSTVGAFAQAESRALPLASVPVVVLAAHTDGTAAATLAPAGTYVSAAIPAPAELVSLEYNSGPGASAPVVSVAYSMFVTGPFLPSPDSGFTNTITFSVTPTSGANTKFCRANFAQFTVTNPGGTPLPLLRVTALREHIASSGVRRAASLVNDKVLLPSLNGVLANTTSSAATTGNKSPAQDFVGFFWNGTGSAGTKRFQMRYSNDKNGPFVPYEVQLAAGFQNEVVVTPLGGFAAINPFHAGYLQFIWRNESGAPYTTSVVAAERHSEERR